MTHPLKAVFAKHPTVTDLDLILNIVREAHEKAKKSNHIARADFHVTITQDSDGEIHTTVGFTNATEHAIQTAAHALYQLTNKIELVEGGLIPKDEYFWSYSGQQKKQKKDTDDDLR